MRVTRENLSACKAFVDFWDDHVIIPSVRVFYRHPSLQKKPLMVMYLMSDDFNVFKNPYDDDAREHGTHGILTLPRKNSYTVKNSYEFVHELEQYSIADDEIMVSFDVKSLFTTIPVDLALTITKERFQQDQNLAERTNMSVTNVMKLLDFVLTNNYFKHDDHHYKQIFGCAMGSPISPVLATS